MPDFHIGQIEVNLRIICPSVSISNCLLCIFSFAFLQGVYIYVMLQHSNPFFVNCLFDFWHFLMQKIAYCSKNDLLMKNGVRYSWYSSFHNCYSFFCFIVLFLSSSFDDEIIIWTKRKLFRGKDFLLFFFCKVFCERWDTKISLTLCLKSLFCEGKISCIWEDYLATIKGTV